MKFLPLPNVIAICGFAGSGKDTFANIFVEEYGYKKVSMADAVKDVLSVVFGWDRDMLQGITPESRKWREEPDEYWSKVLEKPFTPRMAMTTIGTDVFRKHFHEDIWVHSIKRKIMNMGTKVIIPDIRFGNEVQMARSLNACMFEIERGERPEWYNVATAENMFLHEYGELPADTMSKLYPEVHESEYRWIGLNKPCVMVENAGSVDDLRKYVTGIYGKRG